MNVINGSDNDVSMRFEGLARTVFQCNRWEDPWGYSQAGIFDSALINVPGNKSKEMLLTVTDLLIWQNKGNNGLVEGLRPIKDEIWAIEEQEDAVQIVDKLITLVESIE